MAYYERKHYNRQGKLISKSVEKYPSGVGRWQRNKALDKKDNIQTRIHTRKTKTGLNNVVSASYSTFPDGHKMKTRLISNSNRLPKKVVKKRGTGNASIKRKIKR